MWHFLGVKAESGGGTAAVTSLNLLPHNLHPPQSLKPQLATASVVFPLYTVTILTSELAATLGAPPIFEARFESPCKASRESQLSAD